MKYKLKAALVIRGGRRFVFYGESSRHQTWNVRRQGQVVTFRTDIWSADDFQAKVESAQTLFYCVFLR